MDAYGLAGAADSGEPDSNNPSVADEMNAIRLDRLELLGMTLAARRDEWVAARRNAQVEKRWLHDLDQYNGRDDSSKEAASMMDSVEAGFPVTNRGAKPQRSTVFVNITRPKTNAAEARLANMILPSDDRNWGFKPTPNPTLTQSAMQQAKSIQAQNQPQAPQQAAPSQAGLPAAPTPQPGQQPQQPSAPQPPAQPTPMAQAVQGAYPSPELSAEMEASKACAKAMEDEIDDLMIQSDFNGEERKMLHDCAVLGTGILKGPIVINRTRKAYRKIEGTTVWQLEIEEEKSPASERVDPWDVFPDPGCGEDIHDGIGIFQKKQQTSRQLRELTKQPGYLKEQISKVLEEGPTEVEDVSQRDIRKDKDGKDAGGDKHFQLWEYWGEFEPEELRAAGVNVPDGMTESLSGCVIMVNSSVIKGFLNPIETGDIPYDFMVWEKVDGECWGYGMPYLMRSPQKVLNAAWRQLMDNSGLSVGPQIIIDPAAIVPADNQWQLTGRKVWLKSDPAVDIKDAFATFNIESHSEEIQEIIKLAQEFADSESSTPQLAQGEKGTAPDTVGGMTILMNSSNVVLGRMVKQFDDMITRPHLRRYYDWYMAYGSKDECKGDFQVDARGTSVLLVRDTANQALLGVAQYAGNAEVSKVIDWKEWAKAALKAQHIDPTDIMKSDAQIAQDSSQQPPPSPQQITANAAVQVAQIKSQTDLQIAGARGTNEINYAKIDQQTSGEDNAASLQEAQLRAQFDAQKLQMEQDHEKQLTAMKHAHEVDLQAKDLQHKSLLQVHATNADHINADTAAQQPIQEPIQPMQPNQ